MEPCVVATVTQVNGYAFGWRPQMSEYARYAKCVAMDEASNKVLIEGLGITSKTTEEAAEVRFEEF
jgi:hypothetical protein